MTESILNITHTEFKQMQLQGKTLDTVRNLATKNIVKYGKSGTFVKILFKRSYFIENSTIMVKFILNWFSLWVAGK